MKKLRVCIWYDNRLYPLAFRISRPIRNLLRFFKTIMNSNRKYYKIFKSIVISNSVFMMNMFTFKKFTTNFLLYFKSVFSYPFFTIPNFNITIRLVSSRTNFSSMYSAFPTRIKRTFLQVGIRFVVIMETFRRTKSAFVQIWLKEFSTLKTSFGNKLFHGLFITEWSILCQ